MNEIDIFDMSASWKKRIFIGNTVTSAKKLFIEIFFEERNSKSWERVVPTGDRDTGDSPSDLRPK